MMAEEIELTGDLRIQYSTVYRYIDAVTDKLSEATLFNNNRYIRYRELFLGALVAQFVSEHTGEYYYVNSPDSDPPDFTLRLLRKHEDDDQKTDEHKYDFEVTEYTQHGSSIVDVIDKKLRKGYDESMNIVVLFKHPVETTFNYQELVDRYKDSKHWIIVLMRTNTSISGIVLPEWHWCVVSVSGPIIQKLLKPNRVDAADIPQMWYQNGRGRDMPSVARPIRLRLPD